MGAKVDIFTEELSYIQDEEKREITKCYPSLDCLYLLASNLTDIINIVVYYQIIPFIASIF